jgi:hypothetical protein
VFEESDSEGMSEHAEDENVELGHMQEILPGLWIGDIVAAMDEHALRSAGIVSVVDNRLTAPGGSSPSRPTHAMRCALPAATRPPSCPSYDSKSHVLPVSSNCLYPSTTVHPQTYSPTYPPA